MRRYPCHCSEESMNLVLESEFSFYIMHLCPKDLNQTNYWGMINVTVYLDDWPLSFYFNTVCNLSFDPPK